MLTLQPIIENAIYYGIQPRADGGKVEIDITYSSNKVIILVTNPLPPQAPSARNEKGNQMALENIRHRLHALYGEGVTMDALQETKNFIMKISYPCDLPSSMAKGERT